MYQPARHLLIRLLSDYQLIALEMKYPYQIPLFKRKDTYFIHFICLWKKKSFTQYISYALFFTFKLTMPQQQQHQSKATSKQKGRQQRHHYHHQEDENEEHFFVVGLSSFFLRRVQARDSRMTVPFFMKTTTWWERVVAAAAAPRPFSNDERHTALDKYAHRVKKNNRNT